MFEILLELGLWLFLAKTTWWLLRGCWQFFRAKSSKLGFSSNLKVCDETMQYEMHTVVGTQLLVEERLIVLDAPAVNVVILASGGGGSGCGFGAQREGGRLCRRSGEPGEQIIRFLGDLPKGAIVQVKLGPGGRKGQAGKETEVQIYPSRGHLLKGNPSHSYKAAGGESCVTHAPYFSRGGSENPAGEGRFPIPPNPPAEREKEGVASAFSKNPEEDTEEFFGSFGPREGDPTWGEREQQPKGLPLFLLERRGSFFFPTFSEREASVMGLNNGYGGSAGGGPQKKNHGNPGAGGNGAFLMIFHQN